VKKRIKKLVLSRETLGVIQEGELPEALGAGTTTAFGASQCTPCDTRQHVSPCVTS
jgi:hypothetical protein